MRGWSIRSWFLAGDRRDMAMGAAMLAGLLMLPLTAIFTSTAEPVRWPVLALGALEVGLVTGGIGALRLRPAPGIGWWRTQDELGGALGATCGAASGVALVSIACALAALGIGATAVGIGVLLVTPVVLGIMAALAALLAYGLCRALVLTWPRWDRLRRGRLLWAIIHALLVASLTVAVAVAALLIAVDLATGTFGADVYLPEAKSLATGAVEETVIWLTMRVAPTVLALALLSVVVGVVIVPPAALITFPVIGRATRRLEDLAVAAGALRAGDLGARSPVSGEDEIARLQTDFNAMAADLERSRDDLRAERDAVARLLDDRRELIATVSHELRTPVAILRGYLESAQAHWDNEPPPSLRHDLEIMNGETERLHRLIDDLFTLSRAEIAQLSLVSEATPVAALLRRIVEATAPLAWERNRVEVVMQAPDDLPPVSADPDRLEQALRNLVTNAMRHTPPGGLVLLNASTSTSDNEVVITVRDTGEGIASADLPHIWDRFYRGVGGNGPTGAERREGAGLGLALVKELTEAMGGSVAVESTPGQGSCFSLRLPVAGGSPVLSP